MQLDAEFGNVFHHMEGSIMFTKFQGVARQATEQARSGIGWQLVAAGCLAASCAPLAAADCFGPNLLSNGDAEIGSMIGWTPTDQVEVVSTAVPGFIGLPPGTSIGRFSFHGGTGPEVQSCSQTIDIAEHATGIDSGLIACSLSGLLQSRTDGATVDTVEVAFDFQTAEGATLASSSFVDESIVFGVSDWSPFSESLTVPAGSRQIVVTITTIRAAGLSTDAYADNLSVALSMPAPGDLDGDCSVGVPDLLILLGAWGECDDCNECDADLTGDCNVGVADLLILLGNWG